SAGSQLRIALGLERGSGARVRRRARFSWLQGHRSPGGDPGGRRGDGTGDLGVRGLGSTGLRRADPGGAGFVALAAGVFLLAAVIAAIPGIADIGSHFLAGGGSGYGEAAPGDHLQTSYHLWLFGDQIEHGQVPWRDPFQFRPESGPTVNAAVWPYGIVFWP